jgi:hypothetical protein
MGLFFSILSIILRRLLRRPASAVRFDPIPLPVPIRVAVGGASRMRVELGSVGAAAPPRRPSPPGVRPDRAQSAGRTSAAGRMRRSDR